MMKPVAGLFFSCAALAFPQEPTRDVPLIVPSGAALRLYLTKRIPKRLDAPVQAKLLAPLYTFDREVVPVGTEVFGTVTGLPNVPRGVRAKSLLAGDFTPLHLAEVKFTSMRLPGGREIAIDTVETAGLNSVFPFRSPKPRKVNSSARNNSAVSKGKQAVRDQIDAQMSTLRSIPDMVRAPGKKQMFYDFLWAKLPYHPQYVSSRTRFDAELRNPLDFGTTSVPLSSLSMLGSEPTGNSIVHARLLTAVSSKTSSKGERVEAALDQPLFSANHLLILPAGTRMDGGVVLAKKAGWFHHVGRLRFTFDNVQISPEMLALATPPAGNAVQEPERRLQFRTQAILKAAEAGGTPIQVDGEGGVQVKESKTRLLRPVLAAIIAGNSGRDEDSERNSSGVSRQGGRNTGGRILGGGSGFGLIGTIAGQFSPNVSLALGYYGLARSVYSTVIARGPEAEFLKNAVVDIGFSVRAPSASAK